MQSWSATSLAAATLPALESILPHSRFGASRGDSISRDAIDMLFFAGQSFPHPFMDPVFDDVYTALQTVKPSLCTGYRGKF